MSVARTFACPDVACSDVAITIVISGRRLLHIPTASFERARRSFECRMMLPHGTARAAGVWEIAALAYTNLVPRSSFDDRCSMRWKSPGVAAVLAFRKL
jgi:hypothetical protein